LASPDGSKKARFGGLFLFGASITRRLSAKSRHTHVADERPLTIQHQLNGCAAAEESPLSTCNAGAQPAGCSDYCMAFLQPFLHAITHFFLPDSTDHIPIAENTGEPGRRLRTVSEVLESLPEQAC